LPPYYRTGSIGNRRLSQVLNRLPRLEFRQDERGFHPFSSPVPGKECAGATGRAADNRATSPLSPRIAPSSPPHCHLGQPSAQPIPCPGIEPTASEENALELVALLETLRPGAGGARPGGNRGACTGRILSARCARIALITTGSSMHAMMRRSERRCRTRASGAVPSASPRGARASTLAASALPLPRPALLTSARCALLGANTPW